MTELRTSDESPAPAPPPTTREEWDAAWKMFNDGLRQLRRLALQDGVTIKLSIPTIGQKSKGKKK